MDIKDLGCYYTTLKSDIEFNGPPTKRRKSAATMVTRCQNRPMPICRNSSEGSHTPNSDSSSASANTVLAMVPADRHTGDVARIVALLGESKKLLDDTTKRQAKAMEIAQKLLDNGEGL